MSGAEIIACILGMCAVSYIPRVLPPFLLSKRRMPPVVERWLRYVPTSVFGALVFSEVFIDGERLNFSWNNISFLASCVVLIVAVRTKSLGKCIVTGVFVFWLLGRSI